MILLISGETASGKDTLAKLLQTKGLKTCCSYTTRPIRPSEINHREHHFISDKEADEILKTRQSELCAYTKIGDYRYFSLFEDLKDSDIYVIDPNGIKTLIDKFGDSIDIKIIYITCDYKTALERAVIRGDDIDTFNKRVASEKEQFENFDFYDEKFINISYQKLFEYADTLYSQFLSEKDKGENIWQEV